MKKELVIEMIDEKMKQMEEASAKNILSGNLNFGLHLNLYKDSPYKEALLKKKKPKYFIIGSIFYDHCSDDRYVFKHI